MHSQRYIMRFRHVLCALTVLTLVDCSPRGSTPLAAPTVSTPARVTLNLTPDAAAFFVGTHGQVVGHAFDPAGYEIEWKGVRRLVSSDSSVLLVSLDNSVIARRVGFAQLRLSWLGPITVSDSASVAVGYHGSGTVRFIRVEGGCWVIETDPHTALYVPDLPSVYRVDGLRVRIVARPRSGGDFCMVGTGVDLDSVRVDTP